jgi:PmbA protein
MIETIQQALEQRKSIKAWIIRHDKVEETQQYDIKDHTESYREVRTETFSVDVLCDSEDAEGNPGSGLGTVSFLPGGEIDSALDQAILTAQLVHNEPYDFASPEDMPAVELADTEYLNDPEGELNRIMKTLHESSAAYPHVRLTAAECFGQIKHTHLISSKGIDASQTATDLYLQWIYLAGEGQDEVETFAEIRRRRIADLNLAEEASLSAQYTSDRLGADQPETYAGPVYVQGSTLAEMVAGEPLSMNLLSFLSSASLKYSGETPWKEGESIFRGEVNGDPFNVWANRQLPFGVPSNAFDDEGIPAQRIALIEDNNLVTFIADQRFAHYLGQKPSGSFGSAELPAGSRSDTELQEGTYVEIAEFSWFNPNPITGDFASEIRLGYRVENGVRTPFKGGLLVGNLLDALADVHWSKETGFFGNYLGPRAARFNSLQVAG